VKLKQDRPAPAKEPRAPSLGDLRRLYEQSTQFVQPR
jgi:hypothetical protein